MIEDGQELLLDELDPPVPAHREQAHDGVEIAACAAEPGQHDERKRTPHHAAGNMRRGVHRTAPGLRQKSWKLNQL